MPVHSNYSDDECLFSGLPQNKCPHCRVYDDDDLESLEANETPDYEVVRVFESQFKGTCTVEPSHNIKRGDRVSIVRRADNPFIPVRGVACKTCTLLLPKARS